MSSENARQSIRTKIKRVTVTDIDFGESREVAQAETRISKPSAGEVSAAQTGVVLKREDVKSMELVVG